MIQEILRFSPDVVCLQEVDHPRLLMKALQSVGYVGQFFQKPDSPCIYMQESNGPDGCAIFYKESKFERIMTSTRVLKVWNASSNQVRITVHKRGQSPGGTWNILILFFLLTRSSSLLSYGAERADRRLWWPRLT